MVFDGNTLGHEFILSKSMEVEYTTSHKPIGINFIKCLMDGRNISCRFVADSSQMTSSGLIQGL